jgi:putative mRNA 3-end processing factor
MSVTPEPPLIVATERGLYCPAGGFHIDPWQPAEAAVITHAHGDHLRPGSGRYLLAAPGRELASRRLGAEARIDPIDYGAVARYGDVEVSLHPAGHILGSAQVRIAHQGRTWVVSGDYKRDADPTCDPFVPIRCDVFVSEATFALPVYRWPRTESVIAEIAAWWASNRERGLCSILGVYALGKAQRVLAELRLHTREPVYVHGALEGLIADYRAAGVTLAPTLPVGLATRRSYAGELVLAPPSAIGTTWMRRFGEHAIGFCSGWMRIRGNRRRRGYDRGFVLSDHADWPALLRTFEETGARTVLLTHGHSDTLVRYLRECGMAADALATAYGAED